MRYDCWTAPPSTVNGAYGSPLYGTLYFYFPQWCDPDNPISSGQVVAREIAAASQDLKVTASYTLHGVEETQWTPSFDTNTEWWRKFFKALAHDLHTRIKNTRMYTPPVIWIDHARFPGRRTGTWPRQLQSTCVEPLKQALNTKVSMYGTPSALTIWDWAFNYDWSDDEVAEALPWIILPGQHRSQNGMPTMAEFCAALAWCKQRNIQNVHLWSNPAASPEVMWRQALTCINAINGMVLAPPPKPELPPTVQRPGESWVDFMQRLADYKAG